MVNESELLAAANDVLVSTCEANRYHSKDLALGVDGEKEHAIETMGWVTKLRADSSLPLKLAALFHDIDRIVTPNMGGLAEGFKGKRPSIEYQSYKKQHAKRSSDYACQQLLQKGFSAEVIRKTRYYINHHADSAEELELEGNEELNALVAADALAFLTNDSRRISQYAGEEVLKLETKLVMDSLPQSVKSKISEITLK